jgi:hypothetical protein
MRESPGVMEWWSNGVYEIPSIKSQVSGFSVQVSASMDIFPDT